MRRILVGAALAAVSVLASTSFAGDPRESQPPPNSPPRAWEEFSRRFDLDADGRVTWDEFQRVVSGFAALDRDHDGAITKAEFDAAAPAGGLSLDGPRPGLAPWASPIWAGMPGACGEGGACEGGVCLGGSCRGGSGGSMAQTAPWVAVGMLGDAADADHDDVITTKEWDALVAKVLPDPKGTVSPDALRALAPEAMPPGVDGLWTSLLDRDANGRIDGADLHAVFAAVDTNRDGKVDKTDTPPAGVGSKPAVPPVAPEASPPAGTKR